MNEFCFVYSVFSISEKKKSYHWRSMLLALLDVFKHRKPKVNNCLCSLERVLQYVCNLPDYEMTKLNLGTTSSQEILINI